MIKSFNLELAKVESVTTSFMRKSEHTYFCVWHKHNGVAFFSNMLDALAFGLERQLTINF